MAVMTPDFWNLALVIAGWEFHLITFSLSILLLVASNVKNLSRLPPPPNLYFFVCLSTSVCFFSLLFVS